MRGGLLLLLCCFSPYVTFVQGYNIGLFMGPDSMEWHSLRHAVDQWNNENAVRSELSLDVVTPAESSVRIESQLCDLLQNSVVAIFVPSSVDDNDLQMVYSMCYHFHVPCVTVHGREFFPPEGNDYVTSVAAAYGSTALASLELVVNLRWRSFVLIYQNDFEVSEIVDLLAVWSRERGTIPPRARVRKLPEGTNDYQPFLKYIREVLRETNIIIHTNEIGLVHRILSQASGMNMTEAKYSYVVTNTDLSLLEDFLQSMHQIYHCNITGLQLVKSDPLVKTELALTSDAVNLIGNALTGFKKHNTPIESSALLCDAHDIWNDGQRLNPAIRSMSFTNGVTGHIQTDSRGRRLKTMFDGIGRINGKFVKLGNWTQSRGWKFDSKYANKWEFDIDPDAEDLAGLTLRVVVYLEEPFVMRANNKIGYEGFCIDLLVEMANILKFNFTIIEVVDGSYGIEDDSGRWNGLIGVLQRHEADLSVSAVTITYSRVEVVDFSLPFMHLGISILLAKSNEDVHQKSTLFTFLEPLSFSVWISLLASYLLVSFTMWLLARFSPYEWFDIQQIDERDKSMDNHKNQFSILNSLWFAVGSLMQQGSDVIPRAAATRIVAVIWWMFTLILISSYTAQLAAFLTVERMTTPIESTADLASQQKIKYGTLKSGSTMDFFRESKIPIYERMWSIMESSSPTVFVNSSREGIARVKAGNYAYMMESSMLEYYIERDCELQSIGGLLDSKGYGIALPKGSPLRDIMSRTVLQLQERTILEALKNKWWRDRREGVPCAAQKETQSVSSFKSVFGIFYVLFAGLVIAFLMAIGEYCVESRHRSFRLQLTIIGKLIMWWQELGSGEKKTVKNRRKLRNIQLDNISERPRSSPGGDANLSLLSSNGQTGVSMDCTGEEPSTSRVPSQTNFRRISRMIPLMDEMLLQRRISSCSGTSHSQ